MRQNMGNFGWISFALGVLALTIPSMPQAFAQHRAAYDGYRRSTAQGRWDLSGDEFFTQSERDLVRRVQADLSVDRAVARDAAARATKPAGDYAVTTVDRGIAARVRSALSGDSTLLVSDENVHIKVDNG